MDESTGGRRAGVYVRISRDREGAGLGVERQEKDCREKATTLGWQVVDTYRDNDVSASDRRKKRREYLRLMEDIESGKIDAILTWHMDRLHRQPAELESFIDVLDGRDVAIQTVKAGEVDANTPSGRLVLRMLGAAARYEVDHKSERIRRKMRELAESGERNGGTRAFGYDGDEVNHAEADEIRAAAQAILIGGSLRGVCRDLNARGVQPVLGEQWTSTSLRRMLLSERLVGKRVHLGRVVSAAKWPPILDVETQAALRRVLLDESRRTNGGKLNRRLLLSGGLLRCWRCGAQMYSRPRPLIIKGEQQFLEDGSKATQDTYVCIAPVPDDRSGCRNGKTRVIAADLDDYVARSVMTRYLESPALAQALAEQGDAQAEQARLTAAADDLRQRLAELEQDYRVLRMMNRETYLRTHADLTAQVKETDLKINAASGQTFLRDVPRDPEELKTAYEEGTLDWRRAFIGSVVDRVTVGPGRRGYNRFDPERITITYKS